VCTIAALVFPCLFAQGPNQFTWPIPNGNEVYKRSEHCRDAKPKRYDFLGDSVLDSSAGARKVSRKRQVERLYAEENCATDAQKGARKTAGENPLKETA
jgi:hypothetical protein